MSSPEQVKCEVRATLDQELVKQAVNSSISKPARYIQRQPVSRRAEKEEEPVQQQVPRNVVDLTRSQTRRYAFGFGQPYITSQALTGM